MKAASRLKVLFEATEGASRSSDPLSISGSLARSSLINSAGQAILLLLNLAITGHIVGVLGLEAYGMWALVLATTGTASGLDFGMSMSVLREVPRALARGRHTRLAAVTGGVALFYAAATLILAGVAWMAVSFAPRLTFIRIEFRDEVGRIGICAVVLFIFSSAASITRALLQGLNRFDLSVLATLVSFPVFALLAVLELQRGHGFIGLTTAMATMFAVQALTNWYLVRRIYPECRLWSRFAVSRSVRRDLFRFGGTLQMSAIADTVKMQLPKFLAAGLLGPAAAGVYDLGSRVASGGWGIPASLLPAIVPATSEMVSRGKSELIGPLFVAGTRGLMIVALPLGFILGVLSNDIFVVWLGSSNSEATFVLICLAAGNIWHLGTGVGTFIGRGIGKTQLELRFQLVSVVMYAMFTTIGALTLGLRGVAIGVAVGSTLAALSFGHSFARQWGLERSYLLSRIIVGPIAILIPAAVFASAVFVLTARLDPLRHLLLVGGVFSTTYFVTLATLYSFRATVQSGNRVRSIRTTLLEVLRDV